MLIVRALRRETRAEQVDCAKVADAITLVLALDAVVILVPSAVLGLVGDAQVDGYTIGRSPHVSDVDLMRCRRRARAVDTLVG